MKPIDVVRDLGVLHDSELTMKRHVSKTVSTCFYHLRRLRQLRRHVDIDSWCLLSSSVDSTTAMQFCIRATSINHRSFATSAERRCSGHFSRSCPSGAEEAALVASCSAYPVGYKVALLMFMVHDNRCLVYKRIRLTNQQQLSTSTSSFCQQPRLHCSTDMNYQ